MELQVQPGRQPSQARALGDHGPVEAQPRRLLQALLQLADGPQLASQAQLSHQDCPRRQGQVAVARHDGGCDPQVRGGFLHVQSARHRQIAIEAGQGKAEVFLEHRQDLVQAIGADAGRGAPGAGIARGADQGLELDHQWASAFAGNDRRGSCAGFVAAQEQLAGVEPLGQALAAHFKDPQFMGGAKAVLDRPQQAMAGETIPLKGQNGIHQVLEHLRTGQHSFLGDVAHQEERCVLALGDPRQRGSTFPHLGH